MENKNCGTDLSDRKHFAMLAFGTSSHYDTAIHAYFKGNKTDIYDFKSLPQNGLRYGENPHQSATFYGNLDSLFDKLHGKELSYNNLVDVDACITLLDEFEDTSFVIIKHTNACGVATAPTVHQAYKNTKQVAHRILGKAYVHWCTCTFTRRLRQSSKCKISVGC